MRRDNLPSLRVSAHGGRPSRAVGLGLLLACGILAAQTPRWAQRYNGPASLYDDANAIAHGADGNIYVAGNSYVGNPDFIVISYSPTGAQRWVYTYNGPSNSNDRAYAIVVGADGNVYACGSSVQTGQDADILVVSLRPSDGHERWVYRYDGTGHSADEAYALVYGADGNIYVAGKSTGVSPYPRGQSGNPSAAAQGPLSSFDFTVLSLTDSGTQRWVRTYDGPASGSDIAYAITWGQNGNIYAAGASTGVGTNLDLTVMSFDTAGYQRWLYRYNGPGNSGDEAHAVVYGSDGNIYAAGRSTGNGTDFDFTIASITDSGTERWVYRYDGPAHSTDEARSLVWGADGNLYAAGVSVGNGTSYDFTVISLAPDMTERWVQRYDGPGSGSDQGNAIVYGTDGYVYAAGSSKGVNTDLDFTVLSLAAATGAKRWVYRYDGPIHSTDVASDLSFDPGPVIHATGFSDSASDDIFTVALDTTLVGIGPDSRDRTPKSGRSLQEVTLHGGRLAFSLTLPAAAEVSLALCDLKGAKVAGWRFSAPAGVSRYARSLPGLKPGVYFLRLDGAGPAAKVIRLS